MFYVYVLKCRDGSFYTGYTNNLQKRIAMHNAGRGAKYTRSRLPVVLIGSWNLRTKSEAMKKEFLFKQLSRREKIKQLANFSL